MNRSGFTLVEAVIATAVVGLLAVLILNFLTNTLVNSVYKNARRDLLDETQLTLNEMNRDIRHASNVDDQNRWPDNNAPGAPSDLYSWNSDDDTVILASPAVDSNNEFIYQDPFAYITYKNNLIYFVENGTLYRRTLAADVNNNSARTTCPQDNATSCPEDSKLAEGVTNFHIDYFNAEDQAVAPSEARSIRVSLRLEREKYGRILDVEYKIRSVFRNE